MQSFNEASVELTGHAPSGKKVKDEELRNLILALLNVKYPGVDRPSNNNNDSNNNNNNDNNFTTVEELLAKANGKR